MYVRWVHCTKSNLKAYWGKKNLKSPFHLLSKPQRICTSLKMLLRTMSKHSLKLHTNRQFCQVPWFRWCHKWWKKNTTLDRTKKSKGGAILRKTPDLRNWHLLQNAKRWKEDFGSGGPGILPVLPMPWFSGPHHLKYLQQKVHHSRRDQLWNITYTHHGDFCIRPRSSWRIRDLEQPWVFTIQKKNNHRSRKKLG